MLEFKRLLSQEDNHPFSCLEWEKDTIEIFNDAGEIIYSCPNAEFPAAWSWLARKTVAHKYFRESRKSTDRETSVKQMVERVTEAIRKGGVEHKYFEEKESQIFKDELLTVLLTQMATFNSPVWFNLGVPGVNEPQCSACFINVIEDSMEGIATLARKEMMIFKEGSGSGVNLSPIRGSNEHIRGGGTASGPLSFMEGFDAFANVILSGGRTRRAARMCILDGDHPDVMKFINVKSEQEDRAIDLAKAGVSTDFRDPENVYTYVKHQSSNLSVRLTNEFMKKVRDVMHYGKDAEWELINRTDADPDRKANYISVKKMFEAIAAGAHKCGDPGVQFHDTINDMNTCSNDGEITASNPCFTGDTLIATPQGFIPIRELCAIALETSVITPVYTAQGIVSTPVAYMTTGINHIRRVELSDGRVLRCTPNHQWKINGQKIETKDLVTDMPVELLNTPTCYTGSDILDVDGSAVSYRKTGDHHLHGVKLPTTLTPEFASILGHLTGDGFISNKENYHMMGWVYGTSQNPEVHQELRDLQTKHFQFLDKCTPGLAGESTNTNGCTVLRYSRRPIKGYFLALGFKPCRAENKRVPTSIMRASKKCIAAYLQGYFGADGTIYGHSEAGEAEVNCTSTSIELLREIQLLLQLWGIRTAVKILKLAGKCRFRDNEKEYNTNTSYRLRINPEDLELFKNHVGFSLHYKQARLTTLLTSRKSIKTHWENPTIVSVTEDNEEPTYNLTEPLNHLVYANGILIPQCGEFTWLGNSACNLASLNLMKYVDEDHTLNINVFKHVVRLMVISQDILLEISGFPTEEIKQNSLDYRPLGLGYANIGGLLMSWGIPYDSNKGRNIAASITSLLTGTAYYTSMELAELLEPFKHYANNTEPMEDTLDKHYQATRHLEKDIAGISPKAISVWREVMGVGCGRRKSVEEPTGFRNCQTVIVAPTGTTGFMMDCATTGCEPDIGLKKLKLLVGGSSMEYVNPTIAAALQALGYSESDVQEIVTYVEEHGHVEGSILHTSEYEVFDCAYGAGERALSMEAHVDFVAAIQPFVSGAISKTFAMPRTATIQDVQNTFLRAWEKGVKSITVYREGSKLSEPLRVRELKIGQEVPLELVRKKLPQDRPSDTHAVIISGSSLYLTVGKDPETLEPKELFIRISKYGATVGGLLDSYATLLSKALQYGLPLEAALSHMMDTQFSPSGVTNNPQIPMAKSIMDYIAKWMLAKYTGDKTAEPNAPAITKGAEITGEVCAECGALMIRTGATCQICSNCAVSTGVCG